MLQTKSITGKSGELERPIIGDRFIPQVFFTQEKRYYGPIAPLALLEFTDLSFSAKLIWMALSSCAGLNGECYPSYQRLANMTGTSLRQAKNAAKELKEQGFVEWGPGGLKRSNRYRLLRHSIFENAGRKNSTKAS